MMMKQAYYNFIVALTVLLLSMGLAQPGIAAPATQSSVACDQVVVVQNDDWLSKIAEKVYGDVLAYPAIAEATNAKHGQDSSFAKIDNVDVIETGWKLCVPSVAEAETLLERSLAAPVVTISPAQPTGQQMGRLVLATTTSTQDSGLLDVILPDFETRYSADVEVIAVGTGQALELGKNCDADVVLVHARKQEDAFVADGFGLNRQDVMYNDFVILGPAADPAGIKGMTDAGAALLKIAETQSPFISRGDNSGTHTKEQSLWAATQLPLLEVADIDPTKPYQRPAGEWYQSVGQGMGAVLTIANEQLAYTLSDRATYLARRQEGLELALLVEGDSRMFNPYGVIEVNPAKCPEVNTAGAQAFAGWLTSLETQTLIGQYGLDKFGQSLFVPDSAAWNAAKVAK
jgi:tungstate transport system substrate-binding protein